MKKTLAQIALVLLPLGLGLGGYLFIHLAYPELPLLFFKADIGSALLVITGLCSLILMVWFTGRGIERKKGIFRLEENRRQHEIDRRRFIRRLDHELKNPLTGLRAAMVNLRLLIAGESLKTDPLEGELSSQPISEPDRSSEGLVEASRTVIDAQSQVERLSRLIADLRKLAELEERPLDTSQVNLAELLEVTVDAVGSLPAYVGRNIHMVLPRVPWPLPDVPGDRDLLELAFYNLVENALKYSGAEDMVEVRAVEDGRRIQIEVADNGPGIAEEDLPRVFDELFRGSNARRFEGSGLGLALVKRVIERHGGEISVRSRQGEQRGTIFRVMLPMK